MFFNVEMASASRTNSVSICWSFSALAVRTSTGTLVSYPSISIDFFSFSRLEDSSVRFFSSFSCSLAGSIRPLDLKWKIMKRRIALMTRGWFFTLSTYFSNHHSFLWPDCEIFCKVFANSPKIWQLWGLYRKAFFGEKIAIFIPTAGHAARQLPRRKRWAVQWLETVIIAQPSGGLFSFLLASDTVTFE